MNASPLPAGLDLCVKCGACLPHCPSFAATRDEADSPRGRVALVQGLVRGHLTAGARLAGHLEACLGCHACEPVCPAEVPVVRLVDAGRARLRQDGLSGPLLPRLLRRIVLRSWALRVLASGLRILQWTGSVSLATRLWPTRRSLALAAAAPRVRSARLRATSGAAARRLFVGCLAPHLDRDTLAATQRVYARLGVPLDLQDTPACCGALHAHGGEPATAARLARGLDAALPPGVRLLACATGCSAHLRESRPDAPVADVVDDLAALDWPVSPGALRLRVAVHVPCSQRHALAAADATTRLLARIPGLEVVEPATVGCCGMGGAQGLTSGGQARTLGLAAADALLALAPDVVVSANWGCALALRAALRARGRADLAVHHPLMLVDRSLAGSDGGPGL